MGVMLAKELDGEVVSVDSMQIYRGMSIGTAAPGKEEQQGIRHHMVGVADPGENWSVAEFTRQADRCVQDILARGKTPVLVGGTGLYLDALVAGRTFAAGTADGTLRAELYRTWDTGGAPMLWEELCRVDPESAQRLHPADRKRVLRALEVYRETGETISAHNRRTQAQPPRYDAVYIGLNYRERASLHAAIGARVDAMLAAGLLDEVRSLLALGLPGTCTAMQAIGYKELRPVLEDGAPLAAAAEEIKLRTRQYAKRQLTWLRRNGEIQWILWEKERDFSTACQIATKILTQAGLQWD